MAAVPVYVPAAAFDGRKLRRVGRGRKVETTRVGT
jgi:hypothetical protein